MIIERSSAIDKNDFFVRFQNFLAGLNALGWVIDKTSSNEIYIHNASGDYFAFRLHQLYDNSTLNFDGISCLGSTGFDNTKDFWNQPGSCFLNYSTTGVLQKTIIYLICAGIMEQLFMSISLRLMRTVYILICSQI